MPNIDHGIHKMAMHLIRVMRRWGNSELFLAPGYCREIDVLNINAVFIHQPKRSLCATFGISNLEVSEETGVYINIDKHDMI